MKALVLVNRLIPVPMANEICISKVLSCCDRIFPVYVCGVDDPSLLTMIDVPDIDGKVVPFYFKRNNNSVQSGMCEKIKYLIARVCEVVFEPVYDKRMVDSFVETAERLIKSELPDIIISILHPSASVEAGYILKKKYPNMKFLLYDLDTISNSSLGHFEKLFYPLYSRKVFEWEKKVYSVSDLIVHLNSHEQHFRKKKYEKFLSKTIFQGVPTLDIKKEKEDCVLREEPRLIYAGRFYPYLRDPKCMLDVLALARETGTVKFSLDVYTDGDYVQKLTSQYFDNDGICLHKYISQRELDLKMEEADVLVSLGNNGTSMFPSKIVSYVSSMKPIIHFYQTKDDPVIPYLNDYPNVLLLDTKANIKDNAEEINRFLSKKHMVIFRSMIEKQYKQNLPRQAAEEIIRFLRFEKNI